MFSVQDAQTPIYKYDVLINVFGFRQNTLLFNMAYQSFNFMFWEDNGKLTHLSRA